MSNENRFFDQHLEKGQEKNHEQQPHLWIQKTIRSWKKTMKIRETK